MRCSMSALGATKKDQTDRTGYSAAYPRGAERIAMKGNLKIPNGVSDFKRVISEGFYYIDKSAYIKTFEEAGYETI